MATLMQKDVLLEAISAALGRLFTAMDKLNILDVSEDSEIDAYDKIITTRRKHYYITNEADLNYQQEIEFIRALTNEIKPKYGV